MNFLAHAYLSFDQPKVLVGNLIGDFVRGDIENTYEREIVIGIKLHRIIDHYTDRHSMVKEAHQLLRPVYGRYGWVIVDIYFDHFLSKHWEEYHNLSLPTFSQNTYATLVDHQSILPKNFLPTLAHMQKHNWFGAYTTKEGIGRAFGGMAKRATFDSKMETAHEYLYDNLGSFKSIFDSFFRDLIPYSQNQLQELSQDDSLQP